MNLQDARKKLPELNGLSDESALNVIHQVYYPTMDKTELASRLGYKMPEAPAPERTWGEVAKDVGITALKGAIGVPEAVVGMADLISGGQAGKSLESVGFRPKEAKEILSEYYSDKQKKAFAEVQKAEGVMGTMEAALRNPSVIAHSIGESLPSMLAGGVAGRGLMAIGSKAAVGASEAVPGLMARALGKEGAEHAAAAAGEGIIGAGSAGEQIRQQTADGLLTGEQASAGAATGVATGIFAVLGAKVASKLGIADPDTMLLGAKGSPAIRKSVVRSALEGAVSEGVLEELPQSISEQVLQNYALGKPLDEGVDQAAVLGLLSGAAMGAGANVLHGVGSKQDIKAPPPPADPGKEVSHSIMDANLVPETGPMTRAANIATALHAEQARTDVNNTSLTGTSIADMLQGQADPLQDALGKQSDAPPVVNEPLTTAAPAADQFPDAGNMVGIDPTTGEVIPPAPPLDPLDFTGKTDEELQAARQGAQSPAIRNAIARELQARRAAEPPVAKPAPVISQVVEPNPRPVDDKPATLPKELAGAKERYNYGNKAFTPTFDSDVDRAAFIVSQKTPSKRDADYLKFAMDATGMTEAEVRAHGQKVRESIKGMAKGAEPGVLTVPKVEYANAALTSPDVPKANFGNTAEAAQVQAPASTAESAAPVTQPATSGVPEAGTGATQPPQAATSEPQGPVANDRYGVDHTPFSEGGKPFKTKMSATRAKKMQPAMRVVRVPGGFALADKTAKQLAAEAQAAKRIRNASSGNIGMPMSAHEFIAAEGGLSRDAQSDLGIQGNPRVGNRTLFAGKGRGLSIEQAAFKLREAGYTDSEGENAALDIIRRSVTQPQYTPEGWERIGQAEQDARFEDYVNAELESASAPDWIDDDWHNLTPQELDETGYNQYNEETQAEIRALVAQAEAMGIDGESIIEDVARQTTNATQGDYENAAKAAIQAAIQGSNGSRSQDSGRAGAEQSTGAETQTEGLTAPTPDDIRAQQDRAEAAERKRKTEDAAANEAERKRRERADIQKASEAAADTFELGQDPMANLTGQGGLFDGPATGKPYDPALDPENIRKMAEGASKQTERDAKNRAEFEAGAAEREANRQAIGQQPLYAGSPETSTGQDAPIAQGQGNFSLSAQSDAGKSAKIEDSGEVLEGARKLYAKNYSSKLDEGRGMDLAAVPLSKSWPEPDYQRLIDEGIDPWTVALARAVRDEVPTKPMKGWKLKGWAQKVEGLRDMAAQAMSGEITRDQFTAEAGKVRLDDWLNKIDLYVAVGHANSLKSLQFSEGEYGMYGGQVFKPAKKLWTINMPSNAASATWSNGSWGNDLVVADTKAEAIEKFKAWVAEHEGKEQDKPAGKRTEFDVYRYRNKPAVFIVGKRISATKSIDLMDFETSKEANAFIAANQEKLEEMLAEAKTEQPERREENAPRVGDDHRNGADVTTEQFRETFGFRGEQFGASMPQIERQANMNQAYDALMDLAGVIGIPPKALSLNGELGLAFGARGTGGKNPAAAHYEPDTTGAVTPNRVVINLTRKNGAGSLAHEWFHAVDNYFARMRGEKAGMLTESYPAKRDGVRPEMVDAFKKVVMAIQLTGVRERSKNLDKKRTKDYWSTGLEMAARSFESYIIAKLQDKSGANDYLANIVPESMWQMQDSYPYPTMGELPAIRTAFDNFFATVQTKETDKGVAMFSRSPATQQAYEARIDALFSGEKAKTGTKILDSSDVMGLLGYPKLPLVLNERHLIDGLTTHSEVTAEAWKRVPQWLENPAAVYKSLDEKNPQRVVLLAPELLAGKPVLMVIEPNPGVVGDRKGKPSEEQLMVTVFAKTTGYVPLGNAARQGKLLYIQKEMAPAISSSEGVQFPRHGHLSTGHTKILTEKNLAGYRKAQNPAMSLGFGRGIEVETAQGVVDGITSRWANAPEIVVVTDLQDAKVPERVRLYDAEQRSQGASGEPEGFWYDGKAYIVAAAINTTEDVARVLFHETLGHYGLRGTFGDGLAPILKQLAALRKTEVTAKAKQYGLDMSKESDRLQAAEEVLAEMAQNTPEIGYVKRAIAAIRAFLRKHVPGFAKMQMTDADIIANYILPARGFVERGVGGGAKGRVSFSRTESNDPLSILSQTDDLFAMPKSGGKTIAEIIQDHDPEITVNEVKVPGNETFYNLTMADGTTARITVRKSGPNSVYDSTTDKDNNSSFESGRPGENPQDVDPHAEDVWIDVSRLKPGQNGIRVYSIASTFAHNTDRIFIGDPNGLSDEAMRRRAENMLSSALKFGTTKHLAPHPRQTVGGVGVPALKWVYGDDVGNIERLIDLNLKALDNADPYAKQLAYDLDTGTFSDARTGRQITRAELVASATQRRGRDGSSAVSQAGWRTIARGAVFRALLGRGGAQGNGAGRPGSGGRVLDGLVRQREKLASPSEKERVFYSRSVGATQLAGQVRDKLNETFNHPGKLNWWHKTVGSQYNLAERNPAFKKVFDSAQDFINDVSYYATEAANMAPKILPKLETLRDLTKSAISAADNKAVAAPVFEGTLSWARDADGKPIRIEALERQYENLTDDQKAQMLLRKNVVSEAQLKAWKASKLDVYQGAIRNRFEDAFLKAGVRWSDAELKSIFKLSDEQVGLYKEFRAATDQSLDNMAKAQMLREAGKDVMDMRDAVMEAPDVDTAAQMLRETLLDMAKDDPDRVDILTDAAAGVLNTAAKINGLKKQGYAPLSRFGRFTVDVVADGKREYFGLFESEGEANRMAAKMRMEFDKDNVAQGTMSQKEFELFQGITPESLELFGNMMGLDSTGNEAQDKAFQTYLKLTKNNRSAMKRLIHRQGIAGYSEDVGRVLAAFVYSNARQTSAALHIGQMDEAITEIPKGEGELKDHALELAKYIKEPREEAAGLRGLMFAQYLGGSVASAMVNFTQPLTVSIPYLSQFGGLAKAGKAWAQAVKDMSQGVKLEAGLERALKDAEESGVVSPQEVHQLMAQARGASTLQSGDGTRMGDAKAMAANGWTRTALAWGKLFGYAEQVNRRSTFIAAYRMAVEQKMPNPGKFAEKAVNETQFVNNKANKMKFGRGAIGATLMTFKSYSIHWLELMHRLSTQDGKDGKLAAAYMMGALFLVAGAGGLPFAADAEDLIDAIAQKMGYNFSAKKSKQEFLESVFGKAGAEFVDRGLTGLPGVPIDVSGRMGMSNLIPGTGLLLEKKDHGRDLMELAGPAGDITKRFFEAVGLLARGEVLDAAAKAAPSALGNVIKGADMLDKGMYRDTKGAKVIDTTTGEALAKMAGFQPASVSQVQEANYINQRAKDFYSLKAQEMRAKWAMGIFENDPDKVADARKMMDEWNQDNPDQRMSANMPAIVKKVREMRKDKSQRIADTAPKAMRAQMRADARELAAQ